MQLSAFPPGADGSGLVDGLAVLRVEAAITRTLVAESRASVGIRIAGAACVWDARGWRPLPRSTLSGVHCGSRIVRTEAGSALVLAHLNPAALPALGVQACALVDRSVDLADVWPAADLSALAARLVQCRDDAGGAACLEAFVAARVRREAIDPAIVQAVHRIRAARGDLAISELARELAFSVATLERRFTARVGVSPKRFARAVRLRGAVLAYSAGAKLTDVALDAGYYDQSHFVRDVRLATGETPSRLLPSQRYC